MQFPEGFFDSFSMIPSFNREKFQSSFMQQAPVSFRYAGWCETKDLTAHAVAVPWASNAFTLQQRPLFVADPLWHAGGYYVQEASSMFLDHVLDQLPERGSPEVWLDMCAAPGGKSLILCDHLGKQDVLVSNEVIAARNAILRENISRWGSCGTVVTRAEAGVFSAAGALFDRVVADVPCSGSGLFRREPSLSKNWSRENVLFCAARQKKLLHELIPLVRRGGYLIYSTCSFSQEENEDVLDYLADQYDVKGVDVPLENGWGIVQASTPVHNISCYRFWPDRLQGEGFFMAVLRLGTGVSDEQIPYARSKPLNVALPASCEQGTAFYQKGNEVIVSTPEAAAWHATFEKLIDCRQWGLPVFELNKGHVQPLQGLASSRDCRNGYPVMDLALKEATAFLSGQALDNTQALKGYVLLRYRNVALGFGKAVDKRINNLYPHGWRIRKQVDWL